MKKRRRGSPRKKEASPRIELPSGLSRDQILHRLAAYPGLSQKLDRGGFDIDNLAKWLEIHFGKVCVGRLEGETALAELIRDLASVRRNLTKTADNIDRILPALGLLPSEEQERFFKELREQGVHEGPQQVVLFLRSFEALISGFEGVRPKRRRLPELIPARLRYVIFGINFLVKQSDVRATNQFTAEIINAIAEREAIDAGYIAKLRARFSGKRQWHFGGIPEPRSKFNNDHPLVKRQNRRPLPKTPHDKP